MTKNKTPRYKDSDEWKDEKSRREESSLEKRLETNEYCCFDCSVNYLTEEQKEEHRVNTFHIGVCTICSEEKAVTHIRNYNWLQEPKTK